MGGSAYRRLRQSRESGVLFVTIDAPPLNLLDVPLFAELERLAADVEGDDEIAVVVFTSADPDFFLAHYDIHDLLERGSRRPPARSGVLKRFHALLERYRTLPQLTIAQLEGAARGGGAEFAMALDLRFGALGRAVLGQPETALGIIPGGGATQNLPRLVGRARALEIVLGGRDLDAATAERYGLLNRALPADRIAAEVRDLALRIASHPGEAVRAAKRAVDAHVLPGHLGFVEEAELFGRQITTSAARERMRAFLAAGGQTREGEVRFGELIARVADEVRAAEAAGR
ncbi:enoyl-CoA hydratase/isomerase family protein [Pseudonocardia thermophila]|mgnify:CR=1 FL=1|uniref:enoyl-CoA hydratase/isomerase family protein n=1 Tax=Pseudonocardia thermophila TaxID=1848 RepID=UPI00248EBEE3|nr:enoyl-CoA hydratase/isomerase family protein [Pseudonocardia thermophila]